jgi:hemolysin D
MPVQFLTPLKDAHEFKPLLTEIEERPASPAGRLMFWVLMAVLCATLAWLCLAEIDVVVSARGKAVPDGHVKVVQPLDTGVVSAIHVKEGQFVKKGQVLLEIDPSTTEPELQASVKQLSLANLEIARLKATVDGEQFKYKHETQRRLHEASTEGLARQQAAKNEELAALQEQKLQVNAELDQNKTLLVDAQDRKTRYEEIADIIAKTELESARAEVVTLRSRIEQGEHKLAELDKQIQRITEEKEQLNQSFKTTNLEQLAATEKSATELLAKRDQLSFRHRKQCLRAPIDGTVTELLVHTVGGVVTPAEKLLSIMPDRMPLLVEAEVSNDDIGFVKEGMPVHIKVDTFDFQKYGLMEGKVKLVFKDSHEDERTKSKSYQIFVKPTKDTLLVDKVPEQLKTGMTTTCEICVGKRKVIEFFLYPILRGFNTGLSVR